MVVMRDAPLVSIVTPAFNEENFLRDCLESVLSQTYRNWEITIVDNKSTDRTLDIAKEYANREPRIRIYENEEFVPALRNFNIAMRQVSPASKYCKFLGADDCLLPTCLERMVSLAEEDSRIGVVGAYSIFGRRVALFGAPFPQTKFTGREVANKFFSGDLYLVGNPTTLLFRSSAVRERDPFFHEDHDYCDTEAVLGILQSHDFGFVHEVLTFNREREGSRASAAQLSSRYPIEMVAMTERFGKLYLSDSQIKQQLRWGWAKYYHRISKQMLMRWDKDFLAACEKDLAKLGYKMNKGRVGVHLILSMAETAIKRFPW
jgi:glycosyltransferase involved in cell wall biosynthesis